MIETPTLVGYLDRFSDALEADDRDEVRKVVTEIVHPECVFDSAVGSIIEGRSFHGIEAILGWMGELLDGFEATTTFRSHEAAREAVSADA